MEAKKISFFQRWFTPYMGLFLLMLGLHMVMHMGASDDSVFMDAQIGSLFTWLYDRWFAWSTRFVTDAAWIVLLKAPLLWRILDACVYTAMALGISRLLGTQRNTGMNLMICLLFVLYPFTDMASAGWVTTTCVYLWTAAAVVFALLPVKRLLRGERLAWWGWVLGLAAALYASSQEQACCALLAFNVLFLLFSLAQKRFHPYIVCALAVGCLMLLEHTLSPALAIRDVEEAAIWFPDFASLTFVNKLELGFTSTMFKFICEPNLIFTVFAALLVGRLLRGGKGFWAGVACLPLLFQLLYGYGAFQSAAEALFPSVAAVGSSMTQYGTNIVPGDWDSFLPLMIMGLVVLCLLGALWNAFSDKKDAFLSVYVLGVGLAARWVLGFSPTVWGSGDRTFVLLYFCFIFVSAMLARESFPRSGRRLPAFEMVGLAFFALLRFLQALIDVNLLGQ